MNPNKRYRQVLVQCPEGEWFDNNRTRFLFLAKGALIEVTQDQAWSGPVIVRHYQRGANLLVPRSDIAVGRAALARALVRQETDSPFVPAAQLLANLSAAAQHATAAEDRLQQSEDKLRAASIGELIELLHRSRNVHLQYQRSDFPPNVKEIGRRPGNVEELVAAYRADASTSSCFWPTSSKPTHRRGCGARSKC